jgi:hypothetical protein
MRFWTLVALVLSTLVHGQETGGGAPRFLGYLTNDGFVYCAIAVRAGDPPTWVRLGESVGEYRLSRYDANSETVTLQSAGADLRVGLRMARPTVGGKQTSSLQKVLLIAKQEVERRDGWKNANFVRTKTPQGDFQFTVTRTTLLNFERRMVVVTPEGKIKSYRKIVTASNIRSAVGFGGFVPRMTGSATARGH